MKLRSKKVQELNPLGWKEEINSSSIPKENQDHFPGHGDMEARYPKK